MSQTLQSEARGEQGQTTHMPTCDKGRAAGCDHSPCCSCAPSPGICQGYGAWVFSPKHELGFHRAGHCGQMRGRVARCAWGGLHCGAVRTRTMGLEAGTT